MTGRWLLCGVLCLHVAPAFTSTLYRWIVDSQTRFNYDPDRTNRLGVYNWPRTYPESCSGQHQSPVDIDTNRVRYGVQCPCPRMIYRSPMLAGELKNNGLSATFEPDSPMTFQIMDAPQRPGTYYLNDFHLHFGGVTGRSFELQGMRFRGSGVMSAGSEHTIDGLRFEGELHFVFYNSKYMSLEEAEDKPDGVVVIVLLVQKLPGTMTDNGETSEFSRFLETNIPRILPYMQNASLELDLRIFFSRRCEFYTYSGSITTPTCHESVRWVIMKDPIMVTERAWFSLTRLQSRGDFNSRFGNYRTTQPLNDRVIEANFERTEGPVRPMPNGEPIRGPGMPMSVAQQPDIPMPAGGNRSPMLNNNPNLMSMPMPVAMPMPAGGNQPVRPMSNGEPIRGQGMPMGVAQQPDIPMPVVGNRSPMLNNNPNLMSMPMPVAMPMSAGGNQPVRPMSNGEPIRGQGMPMGVAQQPDIPMPGVGNRSPMLNNNPNFMSVPMVMPVFNQNIMRSNNNNNNNNDDENNNAMPSMSRDRSPMLNGNPGQTAMFGERPNARGRTNAMFMPVFNRNLQNSPMMNDRTKLPLSMATNMQVNQAKMMSPNSKLNGNQMQRVPESMIQTGKTDLVRQGAKNMDKAGRNRPREGQKTKEVRPMSIPTPPRNIYDWWNMKQAYMHQIKSNMLKIWQMYMTGKMGYYLY